LAILLRRHKTAVHGSQDQRPAMTDEEESALRARLAELRQEHGDLDMAITAIASSTHCDQIQLTRLKKRKLQLKDLIARIEDSLLPDITA